MSLAIHPLTTGHQPYGVVVLTVTGDGISRISSFADPALVTVFR